MVSAPGQYINEVSHANHVQDKFIINILLQDRTLHEKMSSKARDDKAERDAKLAAELIKKVKVTQIAALRVKQKRINQEIGWC